MGNNTQMDLHAFATSFFFLVQRSPKQQQPATRWKEQQGSKHKLEQPDQNPHCDDLVSSCIWGLKRPFFINLSKETTQHLMQPYSTGKGIITGLWTSSACNSTYIP